MSKMIAACGLDCDECEAYRATQANDAEEIARVAAKWTEQFGGKIEPKSIWCDGCMTDGERKCGNCGGCPVRSCAVGRGLENCAGCDDYGCATITEFFQMFPCAKGRLDEIRESRTG